MITYKRHTIVDGKLGWIVVDENEVVINKYPSKDELEGLRTEPTDRLDKLKEICNGLKEENEIQTHG